MPETMTLVSCNPGLTAEGKKLIKALATNDQPRQEFPSKDVQISTPPKTRPAPPKRQPELASFFDLGESQDRDALDDRIVVQAQDSFFDGKVT